MPTTRPNLPFPQFWNRVIERFSHDDDEDTVCMDKFKNDSVEVTKIPMDNDPDEMHAAGGLIMDPNSVPPFVEPPMKLFWKAKNDHGEEPDSPKATTQRSQRWGVAANQNKNSSAPRAA